MTTEAPVVEALLAARTAGEKSIALMSRATEFVITTSGEFEASGELLREIVTQKKAADTARTDITKPMDEAKRRVMELFKEPSERLRSAETTIKDAMLVFTQAEQRRQAEELAEWERLAKIERDRLEKRAETAQEKGDEAKAEVLEEAATQVSAPPPPAPTKAEGVHTAVTWSAELVDKMELIKAAAADPNLAAYLDVNMKMLNSIARAMKEEMAIPGVKAVSETSVKVRVR